jgi:hypothetical protein
LIQTTLIETVAELTADRDRESLESSLAQLLRSPLGAEAVVCHRLVQGEHGIRLWTALRVTAAGVTRFDEATDIPGLPPIDGSRERCVRQRAVLRLTVSDQPRCGCLLPVMSEQDPVGLIEASGVASPLAPEREAAVADLLAQMMRARVRPVDRLHRFGGEEFLVLLARTAVEAATAPFERLRAAVEARRFSQVGTVTVSIGYTRLGPLDDSVAAFDRADAALYWCRQNSRNRIGCREDLVAEGQLQPKQAEGAVERF